MSKKQFLKDKIIFILIEFAVIFFICMLLSVLRLNAYTVVFIAVMLSGAAAAALMLEYFQKSRYYRKILKYLEDLDQKYLLSEFVEEAGFVEGNIFRECIQVTTKSMNDEIAKYRREQKAYQEYVELWIHEIKTPVASAKLILENNPSEISKSLEEEIEKIEAFLEQSLFYARSRNVEKDYLIQRISLKDLVNTTLKKNAKMLIREKISIKIEVEDFPVYADKKWIDFILSQIIVNAVKYRTEHASIGFSSEEYENAVILRIRDNGIGISPKDLPRVFDRGFTGNTGRKYAKSTGMGLYLCKTLCEKMGLTISVSSEENKGTRITLTFPKGRMTEEIH